MAQDGQPHQATLFYLELANEKALELCRHTDNAPFTSFTTTNNHGLEVGYHVSSRPRGGRIIATLGREGDLKLTGQHISGLHITFEALLCVRAQEVTSVRVWPAL
ncbi:hypothetical protein QBC46DRAFT_47675 [Diplogelasinospora grovesii]|uniref:Uncharacterized protein n=1 Tax=Diplogelasinospora grovesii TaxID=303347 RepID=A0AAN6S7P1_9PEZI|nr:hypothetical protein QBC46DRAFT_47675 [Diplogelasinospora grovesii]